MEEKEIGQAEADLTQGANMSVEEAEKLIAEIGIESTEIALDTSALRKALVAISEEVGIWAKRAGIKYGDKYEDRWWTYPPSPPDTETGRLVIKKFGDVWGIHIEETIAVPEYWDGSNFVGWDNPFSAEAFAQNMARTSFLENIGRFGLEHAAKNILGFLQDYCEELKRRHIRYAELRKKTERIEEVFSSSSDVSEQ